MFELHEGLYLPEFGAFLEALELLLHLLDGADLVLLDDHRLLHHRKIDNAETLRWIIDDGLFQKYGQNLVHPFCFTQKA